MKSLSRRRSARYTVTAVLASCAVYATGTVPAQAYTRGASVGLATVNCNVDVLSWSWDLDGGKPISGAIWKKYSGGSWQLVQNFRVNRRELVAGSKQVGGWNCEEATNANPNPLWGIVLANRSSSDSLAEDGSQVNS